ncbi:MAG TPA: diaminopimelate epimerase [Polyangiaceae bacterium]|jgi:diaminopimelate epimerase|nr:diaminopimelate epimerase [Polyangiaceae bacterium]
MRFTKYQGLGNDFVVVDAASPDAVSAEQARAICDRHFGVGGDGVLLVSPSAEGAARMTVLNADGSRPEMCGNGLRCVALHLAQRAGQSFAVQTDAGVLACQMQMRGGESWVRISLGRGKPEGELVAERNGRALTFQRVSMGNPHAVLFDSDFDVPSIDVFAPTVSARLPGGANIEFVRQTAPTALSVIVWERGVGRTLACGTGAGAVGVAAARAGRAPFDQALSVELPGGVLEITVRQSDLHVELCGPARRVFEGELELGS